MMHSLPVVRLQLHIEEEDFYSVVECSWVEFSKVQGNECNQWTPNHRGAYTAAKPAFSSYLSAVHLVPHKNSSVTDRITLQTARSWLHFQRRQLH